MNGVVLWGAVRFGTVSPNDAKHGRRGTARAGEVGRVGLVLAPQGKNGGKAGVLDLAFPPIKEMLMRHKKIVKAVWTPGMHMKIHPGKTLKELQEIERDNDGMVTSRAIIEKARRISSAMHDHIEWIDGIAAERYRLNQAGEIKRAIRVVYEGEEDRGPTYYFVSIETRDPESGRHTGGYSVSIERALSNRAMRSTVLEEALNSLQEWIDRNKEIKELGGLIEVISHNWPRGLAA